MTENMNGNGNGRTCRSGNGDGNRRMNGSRGENETSFRITDLRCGYSVNGPAVIHRLNLSMESGHLLCILGRNGIGKTTLFRTLLGALPRLGGEIRLGGVELKEMSRKVRAARIAYVPQSHNPPFSYTAFDIVLMGRAGRIGPFSAPSRTDRIRAEEALALLGVEHLSTRAYTAISGGERQLVLIARALCQGADWLLLDEPAANLDCGNQMKVLTVLQALAGQGRGILFTSHDPSHALLLGADVVVICSADDVRVGPARRIITGQLAGELYGVRAKIVDVFDESRGEYVQVFTPFLEQQKHDPSSRPG